MRALVRLLLLSASAVALRAAAPVPENAAPFRLIAPGDKKAARWARMVTSLEITTPAQP